MFDVPATNLAQALAFYTLPAILEQALPPRKPLPTFPKNVHLEEVEISELDARQAKAAQNKQEMEDDDGDGEPRVQCANQ